jgi:hypothetical protein
MCGATQRCPRTQAASARSTGGAVPLALRGVFISEPGGPVGASFRTDPYEGKPIGHKSHGHSYLRELSFWLMVRSLQHYLELSMLLIVSSHAKGGCDG